MDVPETIYKDDVLTSTEKELKEPSMYKVILHNDDYTTMDFVVHVLKTVFNKQHSEAFHIMMQVHKKGYGVCGVYTAEIAETKVAMVHYLARENEFPLQCSIEEA
ncbi:MAG: ATP-dependent Clp protease adapter ClpS [Thermodesulfobacteriota bacterium]|nr:ATP-dependent Clp protease adapter ClpS [Thermodesulfobacteriota bacterium]